MCDGPIRETVYEMPDWLEVIRRMLYVHIQYVNQNCKQKCVAKEAGETKKRQKLIEGLKQEHFDSVAKCAAKSSINNFANRKKIS